MQQGIVWLMIFSVFIGGCQRSSSREKAEDPPLPSNPPGDPNDLTLPPGVYQPRQDITIFVGECIGADIVGLQFDDFSFATSPEGWQEIMGGQLHVEVANATQVDPTLGYECSISVAINVSSLPESFIVAVQGSNGTNEMNWILSSDNIAVIARDDYYELKITLPFFDFNFALYFGDNQSNINAFQEFTQPLVTLPVENLLAQYTLSNLIAVDWDHDSATEFFVVGAEDSKMISCSSVESDHIIVKKTAQTNLEIELTEQILPYFVGVCAKDKNKLSSPIVIVEVQTSGAICLSCPFCPCVGIINDMYADTGAANTIDLHVNVNTAKLAFEGVAIDIRWQEGSSPPSCDAGAVLGWVPSNGGFSYSHNITASAGLIFSYRACLRYNGALFEQQSASAVRAGGHRIFVTSSTQPNGNLGGLAGADHICNQAATASEIPGIVGGEFRAILSTDSVNARDRFSGDGPVYRSDGALVSSTLEGLWTTSVDPPSTELVNPVNHDENGDPVPPSNTWTGSMGNGNRAASTTCQNWTSDSATDDGVPGEISSTEDRWLFVSPPQCNQSGQRLYCLSVNL